MERVSIARDCLAQVCRYTADLGPAGAKQLGQYIPVSAPEKVDGNGNLTNDDYYEIAVVEYSKKMHGDLIKPTRLRGYVQLSTVKVPASEFR